ncbi:outer membrane protein OmpA-like peptidoglycan-associated protein [Tahibacter aquaticus]|uniref:Outer membrane protein OmpA-like peptidoglycan-associated protein n=1 Tax=Tahibacter aquaticus TaxID=520092 RepID=A0A4R6YQF8_9GAMM|nr:OmpA family protein [Tahibacter aquaticus]TDR40068.1 outer membrane protein OmpA-like peptidoglycan-associated protein [Tahibacter aquaticus]
MNMRKLALVVSSSLLLGACASMPRGPAPEVVRLQGELQRLHSDQRVAPNAQAELAKADAAVSVLARDGRRLDEELFDHGVYVADRLIRTAEAEGLARFAERHAQELGRERETLLAEARSRDLALARADVNAATTAAAIAQQQAAQEREAASQARLDAQSLRAQLSELQAKETQRGMVVTLGDVLFETNRAELKAGATRSLDQLAQALRSDDRGTVSIEGHTDATGSREHNVDLSLRRAQSVQSYLAGHGVNPARISVRGMGPDFPVADNNSAGGRLQNRRVEVIVQNTVAVR